MNGRVYVLHENVPYEFGRVIGVFSSREAAIAHARSLEEAEDLTVTSWLAADVLESMDEREEWSRFRGEEKYRE